MKKHNPEFCHTVVFHRNSIKLLKGVSVYKPTGFFVIREIWKTIKVFSKILVWTSDNHLSLACHICAPFETEKLFTFVRLLLPLFAPISYAASAINGILLPKLFWPTVRKKCSSDQENLLKFEAEGTEQFIQTVKG